MSAERSALSLHECSLGCTYPQAFENAGRTQGFTGTLFTGPAKGVPPKCTDWRLPDYNDAYYGQPEYPTNGFGQLSWSTEENRPQLLTTICCGIFDGHRTPIEY